MFSFLKFFNSKPDADKNKGPNSLNGKTLNLNSPQARSLNVVNNKSPESNGSRTSLRNSLNGSNMMNGNNTSRDTSYVYVKKRILMEILDNVGGRKRTQQESGVDAFVNRRRRTMSEPSTAPDHVIVMNGHNHRFNQPTPTVTNSSSVNVENKKTKRQGDFGINICHPQKKPRTRNNEILSYSSRKVLLTPGQKRPYPSGASTPQDFRDKPAFQFNSQKTEEPKTQFSTPSFGTQNTSALFKFGVNFKFTVQPSQPSPFGNITSPTAAPTFGSVASPPSNTFGTNQSFQFGSTNNAPTSSFTFSFGSYSQPTKPDWAFSFNAASTTASPFQFGQVPSPLSTPQFGGTQPNQGSLTNSPRKELLPTII